MNLSLSLNPFFAKKVNPFSIKSEPILQNEPIRILYPFRSPFTDRNNTNPEQSRFVFFFTRDYFGIQIPR